MKLNIVYTTEPVEYKKAHKMQMNFHEHRAAGEIPDTLWLLEHTPVITVGIRKNQETNILVNPADFGVDVVETERGGEVTYHGPGQIVGYIFAGMENHSFKVRRFVERLEESFISFLKDEHNISARHDSEHTGVWVGMDKITAIGIAIKKRVTFHGFAFNVNTNLEHFSWIVPCGINDRGVTSLQKLKGRSFDILETGRTLSEHIRKELGYEAEGDFREISVSG
jgi:lipoyl(octanoyl) transferase